MVKPSMMVSSVALGVVLFGGLSQKTYAAPGYGQERAQEEDERERSEKRVRVRVGKGPCVFVSSGNKRGMLGVQLTNLSSDLRAHFGAPADTGVMVSKVVRDSPAEKAGLMVGDVITAVEGEEVSASHEVSRRIRRKEDGDVVSLQVYRDKSLLTLDATIEARERSEIDLGGMFVDCEELEGLEELGELEDFDFQFDIDEERIRESVERATEHLRSPEFRNQWKWIERWDEEKLEEKLEEMEEKLEEMEKELKKLEKEKEKKKDRV